MQLYFISRYDEFKHLKNFDEEVHDLNMLLHYLVKYLHSKNCHAQGVQIEQTAMSDSTTWKVVEKSASSDIISNLFKW